MSGTGLSLLCRRRCTQKPWFFLVSVANLCCSRCQEFSDHFRFEHFTFCVICCTSAVSRPFVVVALLSHSLFFLPSSNATVSFKYAVSYFMNLSNEYWILEFRCMLVYILTIKFLFLLKKTRGKVCSALF